MAILMNRLTQMSGHSPLLKLERISTDLPAEMLVKLATRERDLMVEEIWSDTGGEVDICIGSISNGRLIGIGNIIQEKRASFKIIMIDLLMSTHLVTRKTAHHPVSKCKLDIVKKNCTVVDEIYTVRQEDAFETVKLLAREEGLLVGLTSAAIIFATSKIAGRLDNWGKKIVAIVPDSGERYLSEPLFHE